MLYAKSTGGFYLPEIHGDNIPSDAMEITEADHASLLAGRSQGKIITADADGKPTLIDRPSRTVEQIKVDKWNAIKAERDRRKAGGVKVGVKWFHSDDGSRVQQMGLVMMGAGIPANLQWKTMDGSFITMTQTLASQVFQAVAASDQAVFTAAETHRVAMEASADPDAYDYSTGWPAVFGE